MQRLGKFLRLSSSDRRLFIEVIIWLFVAWLALFIFPFRWVAHFLGTHMAESPKKLETDCRDLVKKVSWAVQTASRHMPWQYKCLAQSIAAKGMLKRHGVKSTLYLGVGKDDEKKLKAHAWLRSGDVLVTGERGVNQFAVISTFADEKY